MSCMSGNDLSTAGGASIDYYSNIASLPVRFYHHQKIDCSLGTSLYF